MPAGIYDVKSLSESGTLGIKNSYGAYDFITLGTTAAREPVIYAIILNEGTELTLYNYSLEFTKVRDIGESVEIGETITLRGDFIVGEDLPAGVYDVKAHGKKGFIGITSGDSPTHYILVGTIDDGSYKPEVYGVVFQDEDKVVILQLSVELTRIS